MRRSELPVKFEKINFLQVIRDAGACNADRDYL